MPRSTAVWAAAMVLASFSGSGSILTTAEAMPAPGPQQTQGRPRYYFPRHVKRQIVTANATAPAVPTSSSSSSSQQLESRQFPANLEDFLETMMGGSSDSSSSPESRFRNSEFDPISTVTSSSEILVTPTPDREDRPAGTGNLRPPPAPISSSSSSDDIVFPVPAPPSNSDSSSDNLDEIVTPLPIATPTPDVPEEDLEEPEDTPLGERPAAVAPTGLLPSSIIQPTPEPTPEPIVEPEPIDIPLDLPLLGSTGLLPEIIVPPTAVASSSAVAPTGTLPDEFPQISIPSSTPAVAPTGQIPPFFVSSSAAASPSPSDDEPLGGLLPSLLEPLVPPTGSGIPPIVLRPTQSASSPDDVVSGILDLPGQRIGSTGGLPASNDIVQPTPAPTPSQQASLSDASSFLGPFIVPGASASASSDVASPTGLLGGLLSSLLGPSGPIPTGVIGTGSISIPVILPTSIASSPDDEPIVSLPSDGIVIGITTAFGTGESAVPTPTTSALDSGAIPTSELEPASSGLLDIPAILSSVVSEIPGVVPTSGAANPTAPPSPSPTPSDPLSGILPPLVSSLIPDLPSILSSAVSDVPPTLLPTVVSSLFSEVESILPTGSVPVVVPTSLPSGALPSETPLTSGILPSSGIDPTGAVSSGAVPTPSESLSIAPSATPSITPSETSGILPSGSASLSGSVGTAVEPSPTASQSQSFSVPATEEPPSSSSTGIPSIAPPTSGNTTVSVNPSPTLSTASVIGSSSDGASIAIPTIATTSSMPPVGSLSATATDSATSLVIGTSLIIEPSTAATPTPTSSGIPSTLPKMMAPPEGIPSAVPKDSFVAQVCFKWPLNYPFVSANDGGAQIFEYLPMAIADGLEIPRDKVKNMGLKPLDTTQYQGFITTLALFTVPSDLQSELALMLTTPSNRLWRNEDPTINALTSLINTACPVSAGQIPDGNSAPNDAADPAATGTGGAGDGGAMGGDIGASRKVNSTSAIVASSAIVGAFAYGAAMFFVARRYRNKRMAHQRASSVPSTSRMTYGSIPGGAAAWMHGARNGRMTPGSRGSRGSSSTQGRSIRTQQISAPVMAENSLGWN